MKDGLAASISGYGIRYELTSNFSAGFELKGFILPM